MNKIISKLENKALSNDDIEKICGKEVNIVTYTELPEYDSLDELMEPIGACIILYETDLSYGHWCAIIKINKNLVEFFDPYGYFPDSEFNFIPNSIKAETNQNYPYLSRLLYESPYRLSFNNYKFQKSQKGINTCGRWSALRVLLRKIPLKQFKKIFTDKKYDPDFMATVLTLFA